MNKFHFLLPMLLILITAGCQQTYNTTATIDPTQTIDNSFQNPKPADSVALDNNQPFVKEANAETKTSIDTSSKNSNQVNPPVVSIDDKATPSDKKISEQEKIDHALELCNYAQLMWEKGKIEEALSNLDSAYDSILALDLEVFPEYNQQKEDIRFLISKRILEIYASRQTVVTGQYNEIPIILNNHVQKEIKRLTGPEKRFFTESIKRSGLYRPYIVSELKKAGLPEELSWLPLIESGYKTRALSKARALGLWQFIPSTGYKFGLNRNYYIDERLDPEKATKAAIAYLKELHNLFGDWTTALASYNCGEARVLKIIRRQKINYLDNFWDLYQNLPRETRRYVPRFLATLHIVNNLEKYNIDTTHTLSPIEYKTYAINKQVRLKDIAIEIGEKTNVLKQLNPELRYALLPPKTYNLKIPADKADVFVAKLDKIKSSYSQPQTYVYHRVRRGETLSGIATKYKTSIRSISSANHIYKSHQLIAGKVIKIPSKGHVTKRPAIRTKTQIKPGQKITYKVKRGDNLWIIARKFSTTTKHIVSVNNLSSTKLNIGQTLYITSSKGKIPASQKQGAVTYWVKTGDSPFSIAKKYKMSLDRLLALNHLTKRSKIFPGQKLLVE
ncbi:MAG: LysM peptidoglycan-binding domain-containing protein [Desulfobacteraceae bacterium]|nr:LysM peptidoglycan-binding domain-containing protein [Desulfobacteraceae bacterium]